MEIPAESESHVRFEEFELDLRTRELRANGRKLILQEQPFQILVALLERPGHLVGRDELRQRLWSSHTFVDFERGLNKAVNRLREVLEDSADQPRLIETLPRQGYRFIAPVVRMELRSPATAGNLTGRKVSHYRVLEILGGGGMGVVYQAEDLKLGRRVALKFLPEELGKDAKALERFEREARAASALDHPNICTVYEFGEHDSQPFMVMPLLEGQTLRERIAAKAAPFAAGEALALAVQITAGIEAAHEKGIIHRDIKPANIFVTNRDEVKILDFGLVKLAYVAGDLEATPSAETSGLVRDLALTRTGVALGTAAYMSPEQVRGEKLDARSDLFSFGVVLYEMVTGQQPFAGRTAVVVHDAILHRTPVPASDLNSRLAPKLQQIITKALKKNLDERYQSAAEVRADLIAVQRSLARRKWKFLGALSGLGLVAVSAVLFWVRPSSVPTLPDVRQRQLTANSSEMPVSGGAISPDGKLLAYADMQGMHLKQIETGETRTIPQPEELNGLQVSWTMVPPWVRDGSRFIVNASIPGRGTSVWVVPVTGGPPQRIREDATAISVSRDGSCVAFLEPLSRPHLIGFAREIWVMRPDGAEARKIDEADEKSGFAGGEWSPDGHRLAFGLGRLVGDHADWQLLSREPGSGAAVRALDLIPWDMSWLPDGRIVYVTPEPGRRDASCNLWARRIDTRTGRPLEEPRRITNWAGFCMDSLSHTADGKWLGFRRFSSEGSVYMADLEAQGKRIRSPNRLTLTEGRNYPIGWTADSKAIVFESYRDRHWRIFKQSLNSDTAQPIVVEEDQRKFEPMVNARVTPDGAWVLYTTGNEERDGSVFGQLKRVPINGGPPELVLTASAGYTGPRCATAPATLCVIAEPKSSIRQLAFSAVDALNGRGRELARLDVGPGQVIWYNLRWDLSPDGTRVAVLKYGEGQIRILYLDGRPPQEVTVQGWTNLHSLDWAADGNGMFASGETKTGSALLHVDLRGKATVLWEQKGSFAADEIFKEISGGPSASWALPSPDGRHLAIYEWKLSANMWMMENF